MITELRAQNFKSWKDTGALHLAPLTGLFGANSSGKTSILQVLLMLKQTVERPPDWNEPLYFGDEESLVNLGSFDDVIYQHRTDLSLYVSVSWKLLEKLTIDEYEFDTLSFYFNLSQERIESFNYRTDEHPFVIELLSDGREYKVFTPHSRDPVESLFRCYGIRDGLLRTQRFFSGLEKAFENLFSRIRYLGPLREYPRPHYAWEGKHPKGVGHYGEDMVSALFSGRIQLLSIDEQILRWLQRLELIDSYDLHPIPDTEKDYEFRVKKYKDGPEVRLTDVGFGVSQVLPVLILCYYAPEGSILILEQPEAHLHPKVQADLADVFIDVVKNRNVQIILESHSEHLVLRLMRRMAEEQISADDTAFYACQIDNGTSAIERLKIDEYGNISNWPQNFFGDEMGDLAAKAKAEMQRRKASK